jgi:hypothetical protein
VEGKIAYNKKQLSAYNDINCVLSLPPMHFTAILSIRTSLLFNGRPNKQMLRMTSLNVSATHTQPVKFFILKNALLDTPQFNQLSAISPLQSDTNSSTCSITDNKQIILCVSVLQPMDIELTKLNDFITPGTIITVAAVVKTGMATYAFASLIV